MFIRLAFMLALLIPTVQASAGPVDDFYRGKRLTVLVGFGPGGGYDVYARLLARYIGKYIPGEPAVVVQNMPGAAACRPRITFSTWQPRTAPLLAHSSGTSR
jgi:tripartite-type tricarboxylate transporter receptor subunit TctC